MGYKIKYQFPEPEFGDFSEEYIANAVTKDPNLGFTDQMILVSILNGVNFLAMGTNGDGSPMSEEQASILLSKASKATKGKPTNDALRKVEGSDIT